MASFFGEVIYPSSRAFWNDCDEDEIDISQDNAEIVIKWLKEEPASFDKFVIVEGEIMIDFIKNSLLENIECVCTITCGTEKNCTKIYLVNNIYICTISTKLTLANSGQFTNAIIPLLDKAKDLILLSAEHVTHFKSEYISTSSFLRCLHSQKAKVDESFQIPVLNQPNIITGVCAGVLSYAEIANLHCVMYILYTDTFTLDSKNSLPLTKLFSQLFGNALPKITVNDTKYFNKGNLYM